MKKGFYKEYFGVHVEWSAGFGSRLISVKRRRGDKFPNKFRSVQEWWTPPVWPCKAQRKRWKI